MPENTLSKTRPKNFSQTLDLWKEQNGTCFLGNKSQKSVNSSASYLARNRISFFKKGVGVLPSPSLTIYFQLPRRKFITTAACVGVGFVSVFFSKYEEVEGFEGKEHIFTHVQKDARDFIDRNFYGLDPSKIRKEGQQQLAKSTPSTKAEEPPKSR